MQCSDDESIKRLPKEGKMRDKTLLSPVVRVGQISSIRPRSPGSPNLGTEGRVCICIQVDVIHIHRRTIPVDARSRPLGKSLSNDNDLRNWEANAQHESEMRAIMPSSLLNTMAEAAPTKTRMIPIVLWIVLNRRHGRTPESTVRFELSELRHALGVNHRDVVL